MVFVEWCDVCQRETTKSVVTSTEQTADCVSDPDLQRMIGTAFRLYVMTCDHYAASISGQKPLPSYAE
jgi:hypothetical protein